MGIAVIPAPSAASKTMYRTTLTSSGSWTVPAGVTYVNVKCVGGGGGGGSSSTYGPSASNNGSAGGTTSFSSVSAAGGNGGPRAQGADTAGYGNQITGSNAAQANSGQGGAGGYGAANSTSNLASANPGFGYNGCVITGNLSTTPGASISYTIGAGGSGGSVSGSYGQSGSAGGSGFIELEWWV